MVNDLLKLITYQPNNPFQFIHFGFWAFFGMVLIINALIYKKIALRNLFLFLVNIFFYYKTGGLFFILLIISTLIGYTGGLAIERYRNSKFKTAITALFVTTFILILGFFKYAPFVSSLLAQYLSIEVTPPNVIDLFKGWISGVTTTPSNFIMPIGISFFTFQGISYLVDVSRGKAKVIRSWVDFGFYVSFFPQLVSGPIVRAWEFLPQLYSEARITEKQLWHAVFLILTGVFKKVVFSDYLAMNLVDRVFTSPESYSGFEILMGVFGYTLQIYADFSGYTDIAIGIALLLGFKLPINFNSPYKATSITDFWRRWHISLSSWLRDYLYIPLGGNRGGKARQSINLLITMLLGGLWHGASLRFIVWGGLHGVALIINKLFHEVEKLFNFALPKWIGWILTFLFVNITWVLFRSADMETTKTIFIRIFYALSFEDIPMIIEEYLLVISLIIAGYLLHWTPSEIKERIRGYFIELPLITKVVAIVFCIFLFFHISSSAVQPFIYFNF